MGEGGRKSLGQAIRDFATARHYDRMCGKASRMRRKAAPASGGGMVIVPADVSNPLGSRGDEAMLQAIIDGVRDTRPETVIAIICKPGAHAAELNKLGVEVIDRWPARWDIHSVLAAVDRFDRLIVLGADVMDGYYRAGTSLARWHLLKAFASRPGCRAATTGFSFNDTVPYPVRRELNSPLPHDVTINIRDPASRRRFQACSNRDSQQVSDCAFLLRPAPTRKTDPAIDWIDGQKALGRIVMGCNIHPMLSPRRDPQEIERLVAQTAQVARALINDDGVALVLIPHDFRSGLLGDTALLERLEAAIDRSAHVFNQREPVDGAELKAIAARTDLVVTGRMHLAIAALGSGVPVACITYTDKFDGLYELLGLPRDLLVPAPQVYAPNGGETLARVMGRLIATRADLMHDLAGKLPEIRTLSRKNLDVLI